MKRITFYLLLCSLALLAFRTNDNRGEAAGTYGVCSYNADYLSLQLRPDGTFQYIDGTVPSKKISVSGTWQQSGSVVVLRDYASQKPIFSKWKLDGDQCIRSRRGLEWRRLCRVN
jgi:hypothetical protein